MVIVSDEWLLEWEDFIKNVVEDEYVEDAWREYDRQCDVYSKVRGKPLHDVILSEVSDVVLPCWEVEERYELEFTVMDWIKGDCMNVCIKNCNLNNIKCNELCSYVCNKVI